MAVWAGSPADQAVFLARRTRFWHNFLQLDQYQIKASNMKRLFVASLITITAASALAIGARLRMPEAVAEATLIVRVKILDTRELPPPPGISKDDTQAIYDRELSRAKILDTAKGGKKDEVIEVEHNNGLDCPNVIYSPGEDCIVFLRKLPSGHYKTMNTYLGYFPVGENGLVDFCYLFPDKAKLTKDANPDDIMAELRRLAQKK
jgi:hypothetical protein